MAAIQETTEPAPKHEITLRSQEHSRRFKEQLVVLLDEKQFSDVVLKGNDDKEFPCHRVVLAAASGYFKAMFNSGMVESCSPTVELKKMDSDILSSLIRYMYSGTLKINTNNVQRLVESCKPLDFPEIITDCEDFMVHELCPANCVGFKKFAELYGLERLKEASQSTMLKQFSDVVRSTEFRELSAQELMEYISDSKLKVRTEDQIFEAVTMWVNVHPLNREARFPQIAAKIRFPFCSNNYLSSVVVPSPYMSNPECAAYLQEAWTFHMLPEQRSRICSPRMIPRVDFPHCGFIVMFGGVNKNGAANQNNLYKCLKTNTYKKMARFVREELKHYAVVAFQNGIFVTGGQEHGKLKKDCFLYDFHAHEWKSMPEMMEGRSHHGSVVQAGNVYVLGGNLSSGAGNSVEVYNKNLRNWTSMIPMPKVLTSPLAISYGRYIFVTSGEREADQSVTTMVYDTVWNRWIYRKNMPKPVQHGGIVALKDKIYVVGGVLPSCLSYDMAEDAWTVLTPPRYAHGYAATLVVQGHIRISGGQDVTNQCSGIVESYDVKKGTWLVHSKDDNPQAGRVTMWTF